MATVQKCPKITIWRSITITIMAVLNLCRQSENILLWFDPKIASLRDWPVYVDKIKHPLLEFLSSTKLQTQTKTDHQCFEFILLRKRVSICETCLQVVIGIDTQLFSFFDNVTELIFGATGATGGRVKFYTFCVNSRCFVANLPLLRSACFCVKAWPQKLRSGKSFDKYHVCNVNQHHIILIFQFFH